MQKNSLEITTFGSHTCRFNSIVQVDGAKVLYSKGNQLVVRDLRSFEVLSETKVMNDAIMVVQKTPELLVNRFIVASYDGHFVVVEVTQDDKIRILQDIPELLGKYRYIR